MTRAFYNEVDPYAAAWLRNLIADGLLPGGDVEERSIVDIQPADIDGYTQCHFFAGIGGWPAAARLAGWADDRPLWTGSCPCQPFSAAGKRGGTDDVRHLWPHFFRLIRACRPAFVMGEQVAGKDGYGWLDGVRSDLEGIDYASRAVDIPSCAVDAPHIRSRLYWIGVADASRECGAVQRGSGAGAGPGQFASRGHDAIGGAGRVADAGSGLLRGGRSAEDTGSPGGVCGEARQQRVRPDAGPFDDFGGLANADCGRSHGWTASAGLEARTGAWIDGGDGLDLGNADGARLPERQQSGGECWAAARRRDAARADDRDGDGDMAYADEARGGPGPDERGTGHADGRHIPAAHDGRGGNGSVADPDQSVVQRVAPAGQLPVDEQDSRAGLWTGSGDVRERAAGGLADAGHNAGRGQLEEQGSDRRDVLDSGDRPQDIRRNGTFWSGADWILCHDSKARRAEPGSPLLVDGIRGGVAVVSSGVVGAAEGQAREAAGEKVRWIRRTGAWKGFGNAINVHLAAEVIAAFMDVGCEA